MPFTHIKAFLTKRTEAQTVHASDWVTSSNVLNKRGLDTALVGPNTAFGEILTAVNFPVIQLDALYGIRLSDIIQTTGISGTTGTKTDHGGREFEVTSGTNAAGFGKLESKHIIRYRPGQGVNLRFTARFDTAQDNSTQSAGGGNLGAELSFGYNGTTFGLFHNTGGRPEIQTLTITVAAGGAETLTLTLDGTNYSIALTAGTIAHNAFEIASSATFTSDWTASQNGDTVIFLAKAAGNKAGAFTFSSTGTADGTLSENRAGVALTITHIPQSSWNLSTLLKTSDPFILDPSKGNVYHIQFQYLGYGALTFNIEDPNSGAFVGVHQIKYANNNIIPSLEAPLFKIFWLSRNSGNTTSLTVNGASGAGFVEGLSVRTRNPVARTTTKTGIDTTLTNIFSLRVRRAFKDFENLTQVFPDIVFVASEGTKTASAEIHINATVAGEPNWTYHDESESSVEFDEDGTTVTGNTQVANISLGKTDSKPINLKDLDIKLEPGDILTIAAKTNSGTTEISASATWTED